jgi:hypothetical protein
MMEFRRLVGVGKSLRRPLTWAFAVLGSSGLLMALTSEHTGAQHISYVSVMDIDGEW